MCENCIRLFEENMNPLTHGVIEKYRARLVMVLQAINDAANVEIHDEEIPRDAAGILFAPFVIGFLVGELCDSEEAAESAVEIFETGMGFGNLHAGVQSARKVH